MFMTFGYPGETFNRHEIKALERFEFVWGNAMCFQDEFVGKQTIQTTRLEHLYARFLVMKGLNFHLAGINVFHEQVHHQIAKTQSKFDWFGFIPIRSAPAGNSKNDNRKINASIVLAADQGGKIP